MKITVQTTIPAPLSDVWRAWTTPEDITHWNIADKSWCCPHAAIELQEGGSFNYRMEAKDGSMGFDFEGVFTYIEAQRAIRYELGDGRCVAIEFTDTGEGVQLIQTFDADNDYPIEQQQAGWQSIVDNFSQYMTQRKHARAC